TAIYCAGLGLLNPSVQGLMSRSVPPTHQGLLQGAMASVMTSAAIVGPLVANGLFALAINPQIPVTIPGTPFFVGSVLCLAALILAARNARPAQPSTEPHEIQPQPTALEDQYSPA